jgi:hypothetical protein
MHRDHDFDLQDALPPNEAELVHDLDLNTLFTAMANRDEFLYRVSKIAVLSGLSDPDDIAYRQQVLVDCLAHPEVVRQIYAIAVSAVSDEHKLFWLASRRSPSGMLNQSPLIIGMFLGYLKQLYAIADRETPAFQSEGWTTLFEVVREELSPDYFTLVEEHLRKLKFKDGTLISARLGPANNGVEYILRDPSRTKQTLRARLGVGGRSSYSFEIAARDDAGAKALTDLLNRGANLTANALTQSVDHISNFFVMLRTELAFYVACLNLHERLAVKGEPTCFATARPWSPPLLSFAGLYDVCLSLRREERVTGNDANADGKTLIVVTGANSGGKSTFLRSVGTANLMLRSGMFVAAESFDASVSMSLFTHFVREEDASMTSGKLEEELARMSAIVDDLSVKGLVLFNESFSATNEREGSEIARQVIRALIDSDVRAVVVTHLYDLAESFHRGQPDQTLFLQASRQLAQNRSFRLVPGEPLSTSYGEDVYDRIGGWQE